MDPIRVLILEDDHDIIDLLHSILEPQHECFDGYNGLDGLQQAILGEPDLIVCDIMMPVMDGREFIRRLRAQPGYENLPVIFLSALGTREQIQDGYALGAALYVTKPVDPARFKRNIELFLKDHGVKPRMKRRSIEQLQQSTHVASHTPSGTRREEMTTQSRQAPPPEARPAERKPAAAAHAKPAARPRLLVVDDDSDGCQMISIGLSDQFEVLECGDGISAIELAVRYKPDVFVIDGMLPRMTGYQLTTMLRKNRTFFRTPIVFISGKASPRDRQYVDSLGITQFLPKPFTVSQLREALLKIVKKPDFTIQQDRMDLKQVYLEQFQHIETHRTSRAVSVADATDRVSMEKALRTTLH